MYFPLKSSEMKLEKGKSDVADIRLRTVNDKLL